MAKQNVSVLKDLSGMSFEEKIKLIKKWQKENLISVETAQDVIEKITTRKHLKERQQKAIKEAEKDTHAFDALWRKSSTEEIQIALENLQATLRMKRKAYLTDRHFNPELSPNEKKALSVALQEITYRYFTYQVEDILIEVVKYPIKSIKHEGNAFLNGLIRQDRVSILFWLKLLSRQYVAKYQWEQIMRQASMFASYANLFLPRIEEWAKKGDNGAQCALILIQKHLK